MCKLRKNLLFIFITCLPFSVFGQVAIDVNVNVSHRVGGIDSLDRKKMVKIHADAIENDWTLGNNFGDFRDLRDDFLNGLDVYLGRNTGPISWHVNQISEDPNRPGYADPVDIANKGQAVRTSYRNRAGIHSYEARNELIIAAQQKPFFPDGTKTSQGWAFANGTAVGEFMGRFVNDFHGGEGQPKPAYIEIMNEPLYEFVTVGDKTPEEIFTFHNEVADGLRLQVPDIPIGGYVAAFPNFEEDNFQRWEDRMKLFMDMSGEKMDFWSIHLYDFNLSWANTKVLRRGSNLEATFDMMEQYSHLSFDEVKPFVISEYGGRALTLEKNPWTPYRDWLTMKSMTSMLLSFSERPQHILSAVPFVIVKAEWGRHDNGNPYPWRLMRKNNELPGEQGSYWVYTEIVNFFKLWSEVKGKRVDSKSTHPDIQTNAFVKGNKLYVVLNNLLFEEITVSPNIIQQQSNAIQSVKVKHLHLNAAGDTPILDEAEYENLDAISIGAEGAVVLAYTFDDDILLQDTVSEAKYYADKYLTPIIPYAKHEFNIDGITVREQGEVFLRVGMGREHGLSLQPTITFNGFPLEVPENYMGYDQATRGSWFGVIEVPVPYYYVRENNEIRLQFTEKGGHISSMALRVFNHSGPVFRSDSVKVEALDLNPTLKKMAIGETYQFMPTITPVTATDHTLSWISSNEEVVLVDKWGMVTALAEGESTITAISEDGGREATSKIQVFLDPPIIKIEQLHLTPEVFELLPGESVHMQAELTPIDASPSDVQWMLSDSSIASVDKSGILTAFFDGELQLIAATLDGEVADTSEISIQAQYANSVNCDFLPSQFERDTVYQINVAYSSAYHADVILELRDVNGEVIGRGETSVVPGQGTIKVKVVCPVAPLAGNTYTLNSQILAEGPSGKQQLTTCSKENVNILASTSIIPLELQNFKLFPNPNYGEFMLQLPNLSDEARICLLDIAGKEVYQTTIHQKESIIHLPKLPPAMYLISIEAKEASIVEKISLWEE